VVTKFNADNGRSGGVFTSYEYYGLKVHKQGRGLLGFSEIRSWNDNSDIQTSNQYFQTWPYTGVIAVAQQKLPDTWADLSDLWSDLRLNYAAICDTAPVNCAPITPTPVTVTPGQIVTKTVNTVSHLSYGYGSKYPFVRKSEDYHYPLASGGQPAAWRYTATEYLNAAGNTSTPVYDDYGNPYRIRVTVNNGAGTPGDVHIVDTQNAYSNDAANWILGRLLTSKVTHTRPAYSGSGSTAPTSITRVASFAYHATTGALTEETSEPATYTDPQGGGSTNNTNGANLWLRKTYLHDSTGNRIRETVTGADITTRFTQSTWDSAGQFPVSVTNALSHGETQVWVPYRGVQTAVTGPNGLTTSWQYDSFGRRSMEIAPQSTIWTATDRYWCGSAAGCTDSRAVYATYGQSSQGGYEWTEHDRLGRVVRSRRLAFDGREAWQDRYFDPLGREYLVSAPYYPGEGICYTFSRFDALGRVIEQWSPASEAGCASGPWEYTATTPAGGRTVHTQYDEIAAGGAGRITTITSNLGDATSRVLTRQTNVMDRLRFVTDRMSGQAYATTEFDYDPAGNTAWVKDAGGNQTYISYDARGFKTALNDPDMGAWTYTYNVLGELKGQTDAKGQITELGYDLLGRLTSRLEKLNASTTETTTAWTWDDTAMGGAKAIGKLTRVTVATSGSAGTTGYEENRVYTSDYGYPQDTKRRIDGAWHWISHNYDALGRLYLTRYPNSVSSSSQSSAGSNSSRFTIRHEYNAGGYLAAVRDESSGTVYWTGVATSAAGAITREDLGNGLTTLQTIDRATGALEALTTGPGT
jgi:YD repeat-containing protein